MTTLPEAPDRDAPASDQAASQPLQPGAYLAIAAAGLALAVGLLLFLVFGSDRIVSAGLDHRVFYVLLVPLGMSAAAFAFGAMKSTASFGRKKGAHEVTLTGPAVFAALVVVGGFFLVPESGLRSLAVRVDRTEADGGGPVAGALVRLDWGPQRLSQVTDAAGQASFLGLPPGASGIAVSAEADGYAPTTRALETVPADGVVRMALVARAPVLTVRGTVLDRETRAPLPGVVLSFHGGAAVDTTDGQGNFEVSLAPSEGGRVSVIGTREGAVGLNTEIPVSADAPVTLLFGS